MQDANQENEPRTRRNIILIGMMGCGKTTIGEMFARAIGFGFVDVDQWIEQREQKSIAELFLAGEDSFRRAEHSAIEDLKKIRNHVVSVGGGAVMDDDNWKALGQLGATVWIKTPPAEIARRIHMNPDEIRQRPLIQDVVNIEDKDQRHKTLTDRISALQEQRLVRYEAADYILDDSHSTPEICAQFLRAMLQKEHII